MVLLGTVVPVISQKITPVIKVHETGERSLIGSEKAKTRNVQM